MLRKSLVKLKIKKGDFLMCHGNSVVSTIYKKNLNQGLNLFFKELTNYLGKKGNLIVPTFTPSFIKKKRFNYKNTKSEVGYFSEYFRNMKITKRTLHPLYSFGVYGDLYDDLLKCTTTDCFGKNTIFDFFYKKNGKIICCGNGFKHITFTIYIEQTKGVPYRFFKYFRGTINNSKKQTKVRYYVRNLKKKTDLEYSWIKKEMIKRKKLNYCIINRIGFYSFKSKDFLKIGHELLKKDSNALIEERLKYTK